jgi:hypothetical protein
MVTWCASRAVCTPAQSGKYKLFDHEATRQQLKEDSMTQTNNTKKMECSYIIMESRSKSLTECNSGTIQIFSIWS